MLSAQRGIEENTRRVPSSQGQNPHGTRSSDPLCLLHFFLGRSAAPPDHPSLPLLHS